MTNKSSVKLSEDGIEFLKKFRLNRIRTNADNEILSYADLVDIVAKYFKTNNERYLEMVKMEAGKNV